MTVTYDYTFVTSNPSGVLQYRLEFRDRAGNLVVGSVDFEEAALHLGKGGCVRTCDCCCLCCRASAPIAIVAGCYGGVC
jgi:hypothetical protein